MTRRPARVRCGRKERADLETTRVELAPLKSEQKLRIEAIEEVEALVAPVRVVHGPSDIGGVDIGEDAEFLLHPERFLLTHTEQDQDRRLSERLDRSIPSGDLIETGRAMLGIQHPDWAPPPDVKQPCGLSVQPNEFDWRYLATREFIHGTQPAQLVSVHHPIACGDSRRLAFTDEGKDQAQHCREVDDAPQRFPIHWRLL